jgi:hypothetical protein
VQADRPDRPGSVTAAGYLMFLIAALEFLSVIPTIGITNAMHKSLEVAYRGTPAEGSEGTIATVITAVGIGFAVLFGIGVLVLATLDLRGKQPARIITWVVAGLLLCCQGSSLATGGLNTSFGGSSANGVDIEGMKRTLTDLTPGWVHPVQYTILGLAVLAAVAVIVLLALPASNAYFRKPAPQWTPPAYPTV